MDQLINDIYKQYISILTPFVGTKTTYANDLLKKGRKVIGNGFKGVFASDELPNIHNGQMYIANLDKRSQPGSHWVGVYKQNGKLYVYDSFGRSSKKILNSIHSKGSGVIDFEHDAEQKVSQDDCGLRCIVALYMAKEFGAELVSKYL